MKNLKRNCHNEASQIKASCGYLMRLLHFVRNDSSRGAMFGLDARIALAIFGALSVISGAALYSAIQNAKATAMVARMNELGKAWEQFYLDTGENLHRRTDDNSNVQFYVLRANELLENDGFSNWNGPYISYKKIGGGSLTASGYYEILFMILKNDDNWALWGDGLCEPGKECSLWVFMDGIEDDSLGAKVDKIVDNSDGASSGDFRWIKIASPYLNRFALKYVPIKNPHD